MGHKRSGPENRNSRQAAGLKRHSWMATVEEEDGEEGEEEQTERQDLVGG